MTRTTHLLLLATLTLTTCGCHHDTPTPDTAGTSPLSAPAAPGAPTTPNSTTMTPAQLQQIMNNPASTPEQKAAAVKQMQQAQPPK